MGRLRGGVLALFVVGVLLVAGQAEANHVTGTYTGSFRLGGRVVRVSMEVDAADGQVEQFVLDHPSGGPGVPACGDQTLRDIDIADAPSTHPFGPVGVAADMRVDGRFPALREARVDINSGAGGPGACRVNQSLTLTTQAATPTPTATATVSPTATPTRSPTPTSTPVSTTTPRPTFTPKPAATARAGAGARTLPNNGAPAAVIGLSGLSLLELGYGLRVLSRRIQRPLHAVPAYLLRRLLRAEQSGEDGVKVTEDWYLVRRKPGDKK